MTATDIEWLQMKVKEHDGKLAKQNQRIINLEEMIEQ